MIDRSTKLRWRRKFRRHKRQVEDIGSQTEEHIEKHFFRRLTKLVGIRRFVVGWVVLLLITTLGVSLQLRALTNDFQKLTPVAGGIYSEGVIGTFTNANPLYAAGAVDNTVSKLVFSGLMKYDEKNQLVGDLAENMTVDAKGQVYTIVLKQNVKWHDGKPLTAEDIVFTYRTIQNPDAKSPLSSSWRGIKIEAKDQRTVVFTLPNVLSSFPYALTNGIVPKHILESVPASQLRSVRFNTVEPIGSGPFKWGSIEVISGSAEERQGKIGLVANNSFYDGAPKIDQFIVLSFRDEGSMLDSFEDQQLNGMSGLDTLSDDVDTDNNQVTEHNIPLTGQVAVFFKNSEGILSDAKVRQALVQASNPGDIVSGLKYPVVLANSPLLASHLGYDPKIVQLSPNQEAAKQLLDAAGWKVGADGIRTKNGETLTIRLFSRNTSEYAYVSQKLQEQWKAVGVDLQPILQPNDDFDGTITRHEYDALLYGIAIGLDPDVFPYWHSSQADITSPTRLNLSEYKSSVADKSLEAGRTRSDPSIRAIKYRPFLESWSKDAPALVLYQPRYLYVTQGSLYNFDPKIMNTSTDRFANVINWMILEEKVNR